MKKLALTIVAAAFAVSGSKAAAEDAEEYTIWGDYVVRCSSFLEAEQEKGRKHEALVNHIVGWVQGARFFRGRDWNMGQFVSGEDVLHLFREHCEENLLDNLVNAGVEILADWERQEEGER